MDITKCSSTNCCYKNRCLRGFNTEKDQDEKDQFWCNFEIMGCDFESRYDMFIERINER